MIFDLIPSIFLFFFAYLTVLSDPVDLCMKFNFYVLRLFRPQWSFLLDDDMLEEMSEGQNIYNLYSS
jgi:hypothetical protein